MAWQEGTHHHRATCWVDTRLNGLQLPNGILGLLVQRLLLLLLATHHLFHFGLVHLRKSIFSLQRP